MFTYDTMHLTEFAIVFDLGIDRNGKQRPEATNAIHPGMLRKVYRMVLALPYICATRSTSDIVSIHSFAFNMLTIRFINRTISSVPHWHDLHHRNGGPEGVS